MDSTLLAGILGALAVIGSAILAKVLVSKNELRKERMEYATRYRAEYREWKSKARLAMGKYRSGETVYSGDFEFPELINFKNSGISIDAIENSALILEGIISPLGRKQWADYVVRVYGVEVNPLELINGFVNGQLDVVKDYLLQDGDYDFISENFWYPVYFEDEIKRFIKNPDGAGEFSMKVSHEIDEYVFKAREKYIVGKVESKVLSRLEILIRYKLLLESQYIFWFFADNVTNYNPKESNLVEKFFGGQDGTSVSFIKYIDSEYDKAEAAFLKKLKPLS